MIEKRPDDSFPPLLIFPEGTITSNRSLLRFKKGAFRDFKPLKIMGIKYLFDPEDGWLKHITPWYCLAGAFPMLIMYCLSLYGCVEIHEIEELYHPDCLNLDKSDPEAWKIYSDKVRDIMSKMLKLPKID